ncbi:MAG: alpha/beta fold hydrolase [Acidimicrobiia bacterium]
MAFPETVLAQHDGVRIAALDWGGRGTPLLMLHPNGLCAGLYDPIARALAAEGGFRPVGVDIRGHGASDKPMPPDPYSYEVMAGDVAAVLDLLGLDEVVAVGGSLGGGVAIHLDRLQPGRLRRMLLCEAIAAPAAERLGEKNPMVAAALRRRVVWPSRDDMVASYAARPPLGELAPEALRAYVEWGTTVREDGTLALACPPAVEAAIFGSPVTVPGVARAWDHLPHLSAPAMILAGTDSALSRPMVEAQAAHAGVPFGLVSGGHFFLHEDTRRGAELIRTHLGAT